MALAEPVRNDQLGGGKIDRTENFELNNSGWESSKSNNIPSSSFELSWQSSYSTETNNQEPSNYGLFEVELLNQENAELCDRNDQDPLEEESVNKILSPIIVTQSKASPKKSKKLEKRRRRNLHRMQSDCGCSKDCWRDCKENISVMQRETLFNHYWSLKDTKERQEFITRNVTRIRLSNPAKNFWRLYSVDWSFTIENVSISVCKFFFLHTLSVTENFAYSAIRAKDKTLKPKKSKRIGSKAPIISERGSSFNSSFETTQFFKLKPGCKVCRRNCQSKFTTKERQLIFDEYHSLNDMSQQSYLSHHVKRVEKKCIRLSKTRRGCTLEWTLPKNDYVIQVCKTFFLDTVGVNERIVYRVKSKETVEPVPLKDLCCYRTESQTSIHIQDGLSKNSLENYQAASDLNSKNERELFSVKRPLRSKRRWLEFDDVSIRARTKKKKISQANLNKRNFFEEAREDKVKSDEDCELISEVTCDASDDEYEYVYTCKKRKKKKGINKEKGNIADGCNRHHYDEDEDIGTASLDTSDQDVFNDNANTNSLDNRKKRKCNEESTLYKDKQEQKENGNTSFNCETGSQINIAKERDNSPAKHNDQCVDIFQENRQGKCKGNFKAFTSKLRQTKNTKKTNETNVKTINRNKRVKTSNKLPKRQLANPKVKAVQEHYVNKKKRNSTKTKNVPRVLLYPPCEDSCKLRCKYNISEEVQQSFFKEFWGLHTMCEQRQYITKFVKRLYKPVCACVVTNHERKKRGYSILWTFTVEGAQVKVCKTFFLYALQVSSSIVYKALFEADKTESNVDLTVQPCKHFTKSSCTLHSDDQAYAKKNKCVPPGKDCDLSQLSQGHREKQVTECLEENLPETRKTNSSHQQTDVSFCVGNKDFQSKVFEGGPQISQNHLQTSHVSTVALPSFENAGTQGWLSKNFLGRDSQFNPTSEGLNFPSCHFPINGQGLRQHEPNTAFEHSVDLNCHTRNGNKQEGYCCPKSGSSTAGRELKSSSLQHTLKTNVHSERTERPSEIDFLYNNATTVAASNSSDTGMCETWDALEMNKQHEDNSCKFSKSQNSTNQSSSFIMHLSCPVNSYSDITETSPSAKVVQDERNWSTPVNEEVLLCEIDALQETQNPLPQESASYLQQAEHFTCANESEMFDYTASNGHNNWRRENVKLNNCHIQKSVDQRYQEGILLHMTNTWKNTANDGSCSRKVSKSKHQQKEEKAFCNQRYSTSKRKRAKQAREEQMSLKHVKKGCSNTTCKRKCSEKIPQAAREKLLKDFWSLKSIAQRRQYMMSMVRKVPKKSCRGADSRRSCTVEWIMPYDGKMHVVCKRFFIDTFDTGEKFMQGVLDRKQENITMEDMRGRRPANIIAQQTAEIFIKSHCVQKILICHICAKGFTCWCFDTDSLSRTKMHKIYEKKYRSEGATPISRTTFFKLCTEKFNILGARVCDNCSKKSVKSKS